MTYPVAVVLIVLMLVVVALAALILRKEPWHRIRLGFFIDRNGDRSPDA